MELQELASHRRPSPQKKKRKKIGDGGVCTQATKNKSLVMVQSNMIVLPAIYD